ncbi:cohesin domain-containing protein [Vescimonas sp.]|uniref:cohesin domain-containing protein n=1 Tax=Vescimonas sp. TaxID=2892404 RepID=UPI003078D46D
MKNRKRVLSVLLALAVVFTMCITAAVAVDTGSGSAAKVTVETVKKAVNVGDTVTLNVSIAGNPGFAGYKCNVSYDANKLTLKEVVNGTFVGGMFTPNPGKNNVVFANTTDFHEDGTLFTLKFTVKADCSNGAAVTIENVQFANAAQKPVSADIVAGGISVTTGGSTTGGSTTGGSTTGGSTTGGSTTGGSTTGGSTTGGSTTGGSTTGGSTTGGSTTGGSTTGGSTTGGSTTGGSTTGGSTTGGGTTGGGTTGGGTTGGGSTVVYNIIDGANGSWTQNSDGTLTVRADGVFSKFKGVEVDGKLLIAGKDYTAKSGSTIVTLSKDYLATLSVGTHKLTVLFNDGYASTNFTVNAVTPDNPQTGDHSGIVLAVAVLLVSGGALTVLGIAKKKAGKC